MAFHLGFPCSVKTKFLSATSTKKHLPVGVFKFYNDLAHLRLTFLSPTFWLKTDFTSHGAGAANAQGHTSSWDTDHSGGGKQSLGRGSASTAEKAWCFCCQESEVRVHVWQKIVGLYESSPGLYHKP